MKSQGVNIGFWDTGNMSATMQFFVLTGCYSILAGILYFFYKKMVVDVEADNAKKQARLDAKKAKA